MYNQIKNSQNVVVIVSHGLIKAGIRQIIKNAVSIDSIGFLHTLEDCLNGKNCPAYLIIDSALIPKPAEYSLERLKQKNKKGQILLIETSPISESLYSFTDFVIRINDSEDEVIKKIKSFIDNPEKNVKSEINDILSEREKEIVQWVALGKTNKEISDALFISPHTVITHRKNITSKLGIKTIAGLTVYAILNGIIDTDEL